jgi:hypothetical protein
MFKAMSFRMRFLALVLLAASILFLPANVCPATGGTSYKHDFEVGHCMGCPQDATIGSWDGPTYHVTKGATGWKIDYYADGFANGTGHITMRWDGESAYEGDIDGESFIVTRSGDGVRIRSNVDAAPIHG